MGGVRKLLQSAEENMVVREGSNRGERKYYAARIDLYSLLDTICAHQIRDIKKVRSCSTPNRDEKCNKILIRKSEGRDSSGDISRSF